MKKGLKILMVATVFTLLSCGKNKEEALPEPGTMDPGSTVDVRSADLDTVEAADTIAPAE